MSLSPEDLWKTYVTCERPSRHYWKRATLSKFQLSKLQELTQGGQHGGNYADIHNAATEFGVEHLSPAKFNKLLKEYVERHKGTPELSLEQRREAFKRYLADVVSHATVSSPKSNFALPFVEVKGFVPAQPLPPAPTPLPTYPRTEEQPQEYAFYECAQEPQGSPQEFFEDDYQLLLQGPGVLPPEFDGEVFSPAFEGSFEPSSDDGFGPYSPEDIYWY